jgi:imidazole glycerol-phosphate synthase subunit HisH
MIGIVDYGLGNVRAVANIYQRLNIPAMLVSNSQQVAAADQLILPGVGSFDWAMQCIDRSGMRAALDEQVMGQGKPVLGICVGMQIMARCSEEGSAAGLGWLAADVRRFSFTDQQRLRLPHMGWNDVTPRTAAPVMQGLEADARFYFLHSFYFAPDCEADIIASADYGGPFACSVQRANCVGVQFHPEKSHGWGIRLLKNFAEVARC